MAPSKEILQTVPRKIERQMTIPVLSFCLDNIPLMILKVKIYSGIKKKKKNVVIFSDYLIV
jgi:hypothetical protein